MADTSSEYVEGTEGAEHEEQHIVNTIADGISSLVNDDTHVEASDCVLSSDGETLLNDTAIAQLLSDDINQPAIGSQNVMIGLQDNNAFAIGYQAGYQPSNYALGNNNIVIGSPNGEDNNVFAIGHQPNYAFGGNDVVAHGVLYGGIDNTAVGSNSKAVDDKIHNMVMGYGSCIEIPENVYGVTAFGAKLEVTKSNCTVIGNNSAVNHENSVVIGNNLTSKSDDSVLIAGMEFKNDHLSMADDNLIIFGNNSEETNKCHACNVPLTSGIKWTYDSEASITHTLCLQCIYDCVLEFKAKESWTKDTGTSEITQLKNDITDLRKQVSELQVFTRYLLLKIGTNYRT